MWDWISVSIWDFLVIRAWAWAAGDVGEGSVNPIVASCGGGLVDIDCQQRES